ncbi:MAG: carboxypeptidase-like regulatory domain-containing protein [Planctomycetota bacterium]|nr:carboxypeptidase-like regulatory domain-containing protein [Planctomycetota bacterium]
MRHLAYAALFGLVLIPILLMGTQTGAGEAEWIRGTVVDIAGRPIRDADVSLRIRGGACKFVLGEHINGRDVTDADGRFELLRPDGEMDIYVRHAEHAPAWTPAEDDARIELVEASWLEGSVNTPATLTVAIGTWRLVHERVDGRFRCGPLPPYVPLSLHVTSDSHKPYAQRIILRRAATSEVDVTLEQGADVAGRVVPATSDVTIVAHGKNGRECTAKTEEDGTFTVTGLDPGWVRLLVMRADGATQVLDSHTGESVEVRWPR